MEFISGFTSIRHQTISQNGEVVFTDKSDLKTFALRAYDVLQINYPKFYKMDRLSQLGFLASELLLRNATIIAKEPSSRALVLSNRNSSLDTDLRYFEASKMVPSPALFVYTLPNVVAGEICIRHSIKGENAFFISSEFDAELLVDYVEQLMQCTATETCVAGWVDVIEEQHDVLLYLVEKKSRGIGRPHNAIELKSLYQHDYGTVNG